MKIGPRNQWIKELSKEIADKLATFVVNVLMSNRTARSKRITETVLERLCKITGEDTDLNSANSRVERSLVVIADQMASWIDATLTELEQKMEDIVICKPLPREVTLSPSESSSSESDFEKTSQSSISTVSDIKREEDGSGERVEQKEKAEKIAPEKQKGGSVKEQSKYESKEDKEENSETLEENISEAEEESVKETDDEEVEEDEGLEDEEEEDDEVEDDEVEDDEVEEEEDEEDSTQVESDEEAEAEEESEAESESEVESLEETDEEEESVGEESEKVDEEELEEDMEGEEFAFKELEEFDKEPSENISPVESVETEEQTLPVDVLDLLKEDIARISFLEEKSDRRIAMKEVIDKRLEKIAKEKLAQSLSSLVKYDIDETAAVVANWVEKILAAAEEMPEVTPIYQRQGSAFEITQGEGSQLQVNKVSSTTVAEKVAEVRGVELPIRKKIVPRTMSPIDLKSGKDWADWALGAANIGQEWGKWLDSTLEEVETHLAKDKRGSEDYNAWVNWRDGRAREAQKWRLEKQKIKDEGRLWNKKLENRPINKELETQERLSKIHSF